MSEFAVHLLVHAMGIALGVACSWYAWGVRLRLWIEHAEWQRECLERDSRFIAELIDHIKARAEEGAP